MFEKELEALRRAGRFRQRRIMTELHDFASNDYLGFTRRPELARRAFSRLEREKAHGPGASLLVNGYHPLHEALETQLWRCLKRCPGTGMCSL